MIEFDWIYMLDMKWKILLGFLVLIELALLIRIFLIKIRVTIREKDRKLYMFYLGTLTLYTPLCVASLGILAFVRLADTY